MGRGALIPDWPALKAFVAEPALNAAFATWNAANRIAAYYRLTTAKRPETRAKRMALILDMLAKGHRFH